jgi:cardiolipin synthase
MLESTLFLTLAVVAIAFVGLLLFLALFAPGLPYTVATSTGLAVDSPEFLRVLAALGDAEPHERTRVDVLANGETYFEAELAAIRDARHSVNLEAYIFSEGQVTRWFVEALTERARAGVRVNLVLDAIGSLTTRARYFADLRAAGGRVSWYHPFRWYTLPRINNRTHRELIIVDGRIAFVGGSGLADQWRFDRGRKKRWRDTMFRVEGKAVRALQATFAENWVESAGEILAAPDYFPENAAFGPATALVVNSSPTTGASTRARMLFQTLLACARTSINITTPYFLPDRSLRAELVRAIRERGVKVEIITPGRHTDQTLTRRSSRRLYGILLDAGGRIFEYEPAMMHVKSLVVDGLWCVVGSTNLDNRSFGLNDEINVAVRDADLARHLLEDFARDRAESREVHYREWRRRPLLERGYEWVGRLIERQQ